MVIKVKLNVTSIKIVALSNLRDLKKNIKESVSKKTLPTIDILAKMIEIEKIIFCDQLFSDFPSLNWMSWLVRSKIPEVATVSRPTVIPKTPTNGLQARIKNVVFFTLSSIRRDLINQKTLKVRKSKLTAAAINRILPFKVNICKYLK